VAGEPKWSLLDDRPTASSCRQVGNAYECVFGADQFSPDSTRHVWLFFTPALATLGSLPAFSWTATNFTPGSNVPPLYQMATVVVDQAVEAINTTVEYGYVVTYHYHATRYAGCDARIVVPSSRVEAVRWQYVGSQDVNECLKYDEINPEIKYRDFTCQGVEFVPDQRRVQLHIKPKTPSAGAVITAPGITFSAAGFMDVMRTPSFSIGGVLEATLVTLDRHSGFDVVALSVRTLVPTMGGEKVEVPASWVSGPMQWGAGGDPFLASNPSLAATERCSFGNSLNTTVVCPVGQTVGFTPAPVTLFFRLTIANVIDSQGLPITVHADGFVPAVVKLPPTGRFTAAISNQSPYAPRVPAGLFVPLEVRITAAPGTTSVALSMANASELKWAVSNTGAQNALPCVGFSCDISSRFNGAGVSTIYVYFIPSGAHIGPVGPIMTISGVGYEANRFTPDVAVLGYLGTPVPIQPNPDLAQLVQPGPVVLPASEVAIGVPIEVVYHLNMTGFDPDVLRSTGPGILKIPRAEVAGALKVAYYSHSIDDATFCPPDQTGTFLVCEWTCSGVAKGSHCARVSTFQARLFFVPRETLGARTLTVTFTGPLWQVSESSFGVTVKSAVDPVAEPLVISPLLGVLSADVPAAVSLKYTILATHNATNTPTVSVPASKVVSLSWGRDASGATTACPASAGQLICTLVAPGPPEVWNPFKTVKMVLYLSVVPQPDVVGLLDAPFTFGAASFVSSVHVPDIRVMGTSKVTLPPATTGTINSSVTVHLTITARGVSRHQEAIRIPSAVVDGPVYMRAMTPAGKPWGVVPGAVNKTEPRCPLNPYGEFVCDVAPLHFGPVGTSVDLIFVPRKTTVGPLGASITIAALDFQDAVVTPNITVEGTITVLNQVYTPNVDLKVEVGQVVTANLTLLASGKSVGGERVMIPAALVDTSATVSWAHADGSGSPSRKPCTLAGDFVECRPGQYPDTAFGLLIYFTPAAALLGPGHLKFYFTGDHFRFQSHVAPIDFVGRTTLTTPPQVHLSTLPLTLPLTICPSAPTFGGEEVRIPASQVEDTVRWYLKDEPSRAIPCGYERASFVCDVRSLPFTGCRTVWLFFTPAVINVGQWQGPVQFDAFSFAPAIHTPDVTVLGYINAYRNASDIESNASVANSLLSSISMSPGPQVEAGKLLTIHFQFRSTTTSQGGEAVLVPAVKVTGMVYWYTTGSELDAKLCQLVGDQYNCAIGENVTFFRNTEAQFWIVFTPAIDTVGFLDASITVTANNFQPSVTKPGIHVLGLLDIEPNMVGQPQWPLFSTGGEVQLSYSVNATGTSQGGETLTVPRSAVDGGVKCRVSNGAEFVCLDVGDSAVCDVSGQPFSQTPRDYALTFTPAKNTIGYMKHPIVFRATNFKPQHLMPFVYVAAKIDVSSHALPPLASPGQRVAIAFSLSIAGQHPVLGLNSLRLAQGGVVAAERVAWASGPDEAAGQYCIPTHGEYLCTGLPTASGSMAPVTVFITPPPTTVGLWEGEFILGAEGFTTARHTPVVIVRATLSVVAVHVSATRIKPGVPLMVHYKLASSGNSSTAEQLTIPSSTVSGGVWWSNSSNGSRIPCNSTGPARLCNFSSHLHWLTTGVDVHVWFTPAANVLGDSKIPFTFGAEYFADLVVMPPVILLGDWNASALMVSPYAPSVLSTVPVVMNFSVRASGPTVGGERVAVDVRKVDGGVKWSVSNDVAGAKPCRQVQLSHMCELDTRFDEVSAKTVFLFFTPKATHMGPLGDYATFEGTYMAPSIPAGIAQSIVVIGYLSPLDRDLALQPDPAMPNMGLAAPVVLPTSSPVPGQLVRVTYPLTASGTTHGQESAKMHASFVDGGLWWSTQDNETTAVNCPMAGGMLVCDLSALTFSQYSPVTVWLFFIPAAAKVNAWDTSITFGALHTQSSQTWPQINPMGLFNVDASASPVVVTPSPIAQAGQEVTLHYHFSPSVSVSQQHVRISVPTNKVRTGTLRWYELNAPAPATRCTDIAGGHTVCDLNRQSSMTAGTIYDVWLFFVPAEASVGPWNTAVSFDLVNAAGQRNTSWSAVSHVPEVYIMGAFTAVSSVTQINTVEYTRVSVPLTLTASASVVVDIVLPVSIADRREGTLPPAFGYDADEGVNYDEQWCTGMQGGNTVCSIELVGGQAKQVWVFFSPLVHNGPTELSFEARDFAVATHGFTLVAKKCPTWTSLPAAVYEWQHVQLAFNAADMSPSQDEVKVVSVMDKCDDASPAVDSPQAVPKVGDSSTLYYNTSFTNAATHKVCYKLAGLFFVEARGGPLVVHQANPLSYGTVPVEVRVAQHVTLQFSGQDLTPGADMVKVTSGPYCATGAPVAGIPAGAVAGSPARPHYAVRFGTAGSYTVCYHMQNGSWATMPLPVNVLPALPVSYQLGSTGTVWPQIGAMDVLKLTFADPGLTPGADMVKVVPQSSICEEASAPAEGTMEYFLGSDSSVSLQIPLGGVYRVCYKLAGRVGTYADVPCSNPPGGSDRNFLTVLPGQMSIDWMAAQSALQTVVMQDVVLHYRLKVSAAVTLTVGVPQEMMTLGNGSVGLRWSTSLGTSCVYHACNASVVSVYTNYTQPPEPYNVTEVVERCQTVRKNITTVTTNVTTNVTTTVNVTECQNVTEITTILPPADFKSEPMNFHQVCHIPFSSEPNTPEDIYLSFPAKEGQWDMYTQFTRPGFETETWPHTVTVLPQPAWTTGTQKRVQVYQAVEMFFDSTSNSLSSAAGEDSVTIVASTQQCPGLGDPDAAAGGTVTSTNLGPGDQIGINSTTYVTSFSEPGKYRVCYLTRGYHLSLTTQAYATAAGGLLTVHPVDPATFSILPLEPRARQEVTVFVQGKHLRTGMDQGKVVAAYLNQGTGARECRNEVLIPGGACMAPPALGSSVRFAEGSSAITWYTARMPTPGKYCACYKNADGAWSTFPTPFEVSDSLPASYKLLTPGDIDTQQPIELSFAHEPQHFLTPLKDQVKIVSTASECSETAEPAPGTAETILRANYTVSFTFQKGGAYYVCYRLHDLGGYAITGIPLVVGAGEFTQLTLHSDSVTRVTTGGRYALHYTAETTSTVTVTITFDPAQISTAQIPAKWNTNNAETPGEPALTLCRDEAGVHTCSLDFQQHVARDFWVFVTPNPTLVGPVDFNVIFGGPGYRTNVSIPPDAFIEALFHPSLAVLNPDRTSGAEWTVRLDLSVSGTTENVTLRLPTNLMEPNGAGHVLFSLYPRTADPADWANNTAEVQVCDQINGNELNCQINGVTAPHGPAPLPVWFKFTPRFEIAAPLGLIFSLSAPHFKPLAYNPGLIVLGELAGLKFLPNASQVMIIKGERISLAYSFTSSATASMTVSVPTYLLENVPNNLFWILNSTGSAGAKHLTGPCTDLSPPGKHQPTAGLRTGCTVPVVANQSTSLSLNFHLDDEFLGWQPVEVEFFAPYFQDFKQLPPPVVSTPNASYAPFPKIHRITGCHDVDPVTIFCPADGLRPITIIGQNFYNYGAKVMVGQTECTNVVHVKGNETTHLICTGYQQPTNDTRGESQLVKVTNHLREASLEPLTILVNLVPKVYSISGCSDVGNSTQLCNRLGLYNDLTIIGENFGRDAALPRVMLGPVECENVKRISQTKLICIRDTYYGQGLNNRVTVLVRGEATKETNVLISFEQTPFVHRVSGCDKCDETCTLPRSLWRDTTINCDWNGTRVVTVIGQYFGYPEQKPVLRIFFGPESYGIECQNVTHLNTTHLECFNYKVPTAFYGTKLKNLMVHVVQNGIYSPNTTAFMSFLTECNSGLSCAGHGQCNLNTGNCSCYAETLHGFWDGLMCDRCQPGYHGPRCTEMCPGGACDPCTSRGICHDGLTGNGTCTCAFNATAGYWGGAACDRCYPGHWGLGCQGVCPSNADGSAICSGKGTCNEGRLGDGKCACYSSSIAGWWAGEQCEDCAPGAYGASCREQCPGGVTNPCFGHGTCHSGMLGVGNCTCHDGYQGKSCENACPTYNGLPCGGPTHGKCFPDEKLGAVCRCVDATGAATGYTGDACDLGCPEKNGVQCGGHGTCGSHPVIPDYKVCNCEAGWDGEGCSFCRDGYYGANCDKTCPGELSADGTWNGCNADNGQGTCNNVTFQCTCTAGYVGEKCQHQCPGRFEGSAYICGGHGTCTESGGAAVCQCDGNWGVDTWGSCTDCQKGWAGMECTTPCPDGAGNGACSGHGYCATQDRHQVTCVCDTGFWGPTCECSATNPACNKCPQGMWGPSCSDYCPGVTYQGIAFVGDSCNVLSRSNPPGTCSQAYGTCVCNRTSSGNFMFGGKYCQQPCPPNTLADLFAGTFVEPCNGHGVCLQGTSDQLNVNSVCDCQPGYAGEACQFACPGVEPTSATNLCYGHGQCDINIYSSTRLIKKGNGQCTCNFGWTGLDCNVACPSGTLDSSDGPICAGHGTCQLSSSNSASTGTCVCDNGWDPAEGCKNCLNGRWGPNCEHNCTDSAGRVCGGQGYCLYGIKGTGKCVCNDGYGGSLCQNTCPIFNGLVCGGDGTCDPLTGTCSCKRMCRSISPATGTQMVPEAYLPTNYIDADSCLDYDGGYYGDDCQTFCDPQQLAKDLGISTTSVGTNPPFSHAACNATGSFMCLQDPLRGYWDGDSCDICAEGYKGEGCKDHCLCNGHGSCARYEMTCYCFRDDVRGFWDGGECASCLSGYGPAGVCRERLGGMTREANVESADNLFREFIATSGGAVDDHQAILYATGRPIVVSSLKADFSSQQLLWYLCMGVTSADGCQSESQDQGLAMSTMIFPADDIGTQVVPVSTAPFVSWRDFAWFGVRARSYDYVCRMLRTATTFVGTPLSNIPEGDMCGPDATKSPWCCKRIEMVGMVYQSLGYSAATAMSYPTAANPDRSYQLFYSAQAKGGIFGSELTAVIVPVAMNSTSMDFTVGTPLPVNGLASITSMNLVNNDLAVTGLDTTGAQAATAVTVVASSSSALNRRRRMRPLVVEDDYSKYITTPGMEGLSPATTVCKYTTTDSASGVTTTWGTYECTYKTEQVSSQDKDGVTHTWRYRFYQWDNLEVGKIILVAVYENWWNVATTDTAKRNALRAKIIEGSLNADVTATAIYLQDLDASLLAPTSGPPAQSGTGLFAYNLAEPSIVWKFRLSDFVLLGSQTGQYANGLPEIIKSFQIVTSQRYAIGLLDNAAPASIKLLLYSVTSVSPLYADVQGGVTITVSGDNFFNENVLCQMGNATATPGTYQNSKTVLCMTPAGIDPGDSCKGENLEVSMGTTAQFTMSRKEVQVTPKVQVGGVSPTYARSDTPTEIKMTGYGFVDSPDLMCWFTHVYSPNTVRSGVVQPEYFKTPAKFIDYRNATCETPALPAADSSLPLNAVEISVDGQKLSSNADIQFDLIGQASHIEGWIQTGGTAIFSSDAIQPQYTVKAEKETLLAPIYISLYDSAANGVYPCGASGGCHKVPYNDYITEAVADPSSISVSATLSQWPSSNTAPSLTSTVGATDPTTQRPKAVFKDGVALFDGLSLGLAAKGVYVISFNVSFSSKPVWTTTVAINVNAGDPYSLSLTTPYSSGGIYGVNQDGTFTSPLQIQVLDVAGTVIDFTSRTQHVISVSVEVMRFATGTQKELQTTNSKVPNIDLTIQEAVVGEAATFQSFSMDGARHGILYRIVFKSATDPALAAQYLYAHGPTCALTEHAVHAEPMANCYPCPTGGGCDGTIYIKAAVGYWRNRTQEYQTWAQLKDELTISAAQGAGRSLLQITDYSAPDHKDLRVFYQCRDDAACAGANRYISECSEGYSGNVCAKCVEGYGSDSTKCLACPDMAVSVIFIIIWAIVICFIIGVLVHAALEDNRLFGKHNSESRYISVILKLFWNYMQMVTVIVEFKIGWPSSMFAVFDVVRLIGNISVNYRTFSCVFPEAGHFSRLVIYVAMPLIGLVLTLIGFGATWYYKRSHGKPVFLREKIITSNVVIIFLLYPTILREIMFSFMCRSLYGVSYLEVEPDFVCNTTNHQNWQIMAGVFAVIYGALLPLTALLVIFKHERDQTLASRECINSLGFLYRGYRRTRWYWEMIIHLRKVAIVGLVTIGMQEPLMQAYLCLWIVSVWLLLNLFFVPYSHEFVNKLENFSLATVFATVNIGLLHAEVLRYDADLEPVAILMTVFLLLLNFICIILFLFLFLQKIKLAIYARFDVDGDGEITFKEVVQVIKERLSGQPRRKTPPSTDDTSSSGNGKWSKDKDTNSKEETPPKEGKDESAPEGPIVEKEGFDYSAPGAYPSAQDADYPHKPGAYPVPGAPGAYPSYPPQFIPGAVNMQAQMMQPDYNMPPPIDYYGSGYQQPLDYSYYPQKPAPPMPPAYPGYAPGAFAPPEKGKTVDPWYDQQPQAPEVIGDYPGSLYSRDDDESTDKPRTKLRVGLRAPENEERTKITLLTDLYGHSCRSVYLYYCKQYDTKPKPQVRLALPDTPNQFAMEDLILNETTLIGNKGLLPVLEVVRLNTRMKSMSVIGNGIKNTGVEWLVHMALEHPSLTAIDLSDNRITNAAGTVLNYLAQRNPRIIDINLHSTRIDDQLKDHIDTRLKSNREQQVQSHY